MLRKILLIAKRDYLASIRTKAFLFGLVAAPLLFASTFVGVAVMKGKPDIKERRVAIVDRTGAAAAVIVETALRANRESLYDKTNGRQTMPVYTFEIPAPDTANPERQRLELSDRVRTHELFGFIEIGPHALHPVKTDAKAAVSDVTWYANEGGVGEGRRWMEGRVSDGIRRVRLAQLGVDAAQLNETLKAVDLQSMNLPSKDPKSGAVVTGGKKDDLAGFFVPLALAMLLFMIVMTTSGPMLPAIAEDKMQRVFEMLLASATPFELVAGKVLAALGRSLTSSVVYIGIALVSLNAMALLGLAPVELLPWFLVYVVAEVTMLCAMASALGAACGSPQDAQSLAIVLFAPVLIPIMMLTPVIQQPNGTLALVMSMVPPFTPILMLTRQASPGGVPLWQPLVGLAGVAIATVGISWVAARIFRVGILMQGKPPSAGELVRWAIRG
jgi:ABC-2 type transport system permease protein